jgi:predicted AAA+ superfamily ATPase
MNFQRQLEQDLMAWKNRPGHMPLLLRGARQVGKTSLVQQFGKKNYLSVCEVNLELQPELAMCFDDLNPTAILEKLSAYTSIRIIPGETLLFIDEIQEASNAIQALRYFKEKLPELDVIGAGSLLEFSLNAESFRMPVGRVEFLYLKPLSFAEFLWARGAAPLSAAISKVTLNHPLPEVLHQKALGFIREYLVLGGMPAVLANYARLHEFAEAQREQLHLWATYRGDFGKYGSAATLPLLQQVFDKLPQLVAQQTKYSKIDPDVRSASLKRAINLLAQAGVLHQVVSTSAAGMPLNALLNEKKYKLLFLDVGMISARTQLSAEILMRENLHLVHQGALCEQFVGQELLANQLPYVFPEIYYWSREQKNSHAEVDFVISIKDKIVPIEVKSGGSGWLKSMKIFLEEKNCPMGVRISERQLSLEGNILSIPLYMIAQLPELIKQAESVL